MLLLEFRLCELSLLVVNICAPLRVYSRIIVADHGVLNCYGAVVGLRDMESREVLKWFGNATRARVLALVRFRYPTDTSASPGQIL